MILKTKSKRIFIIIFYFSFKSKSPNSKNIYKFRIIEHANKTENKSNIYLLIIHSTKKSSLAYKINKK